MTANDLLAGATLESTLRDLGSDGSTGCLVIRDADQDEAEIYLRDGAIYAIASSGRSATLGARLMSSGALSPDALADALEIQRQELQGWRLGELLVHLGYVDREVVETYVAEQARDALDHLLARPAAGWKFRRGKKTRQDVAPPTSVSRALDEVAGRKAAWNLVVGVTGGAAGVPQLSAGAPAGDDVVLDNNDWSLLTRVDGIRTIEQLAIDCGFTLLEAGRVVAHLIEAGVVEVSLDDETDAPDPGVVPNEADEAGTRADGDAAGDPETAHGTHDETTTPEAEVEAAPAVTGEPADTTDESWSGHPDAAAFAASLDRIAASLAGTHQQPADPGDPIGEPAESTHVVDELAARRDRDQRVRDETEAWALHQRWLDDQTSHLQAEAEAARDAETRQARHDADQERQRREAELIAAQLAEQVAQDLTVRAGLAAAQRQSRADAELAAAEAAEATQVREAAAQARDQAEHDLAEEAERRTLATARRDEDLRAGATEAARLAAEESERAALARMQRTAEEEAERISELEAEAHRLAREELLDVARRDEERAERARIEREEALEDEQARRRSEWLAEAERELEAATPPWAETWAAETATETGDHGGAPREEPVSEWESAQSATAMLRELSATATPATVAAEEPAARDEEETEEPTQSAPFFDRGDTDTASLLRELSSLGFGDEGPPAGPTATAPRPVAPPPPPPVRKRKGLFGR